jgi:hypothetical protein
MWAAIAILFVIALVVVSFAAGGIWLIVAVPVALVLLGPLVVKRLRDRTSGPDLGEAREQARPAVQDASTDDRAVAPPNVP